MKRILSGTLYGVCALALAASVAACGGGGGGGGATPPTGGGSGGSTPGPTQTQSAAGALALNGSALANAKVTFTCGCSQGAGLISTDANGNYTITQTAPAAPSGNGTYTLKGNNVLIIGYSPNSATQVWTMDFVGKTSATDLYLSSATSDTTATTAAALYLYYEVQYNPTIANSSDQTFDWFNFNAVSAWAAHLATAPDATETKLLTDITTAQSNGTTLFPYTPSWNPTTDGSNSQIEADLSAVSKDTVDTSIPTPCSAPDQCTGAPTP